MSTQEAANQLGNVIVEYSVKNSNPVLEIISSNEPYLLNKKYPEGRLIFGEDLWRAYYHSHDLGKGQSDEHGHFHFFYRVGDSGKASDDWTHIAGLSMGDTGQPLCWFTVNNWVTGDAWFDADSLIDVLTFEFDEDVLISRWLGALIYFYREIIIDLVSERDAQVRKRIDREPMKKFLMNRDFYYLSSKKVELLSDLKVALNQ